VQIAASDIQKLTHRSITTLEHNLSLIIEVQRYEIKSEFSHSEVHFIIEVQHFDSKSLNFIVKV